MSASRERRTRAQDPLTAQLKEQKKSVKESEKQRSAVISAIVVVGLIFSIGISVWNQGFYQRSATAVSIDGSNYTAAHLQLLYSDQIYAALIGTIPQAEDGFAYNYSLAPDEVTYSFATGETWHDIFVQYSIIALQELHAITTAAQKNGYELPQEGQDEFASTVVSLNTAWIGQTSNLDSYLRYQYGAYMTEQAFLDILYMQLVANYYGQSMSETFENTQDELDTYYMDNKDELDVINLSQFVFTAYTDTTTLVEDEIKVLSDEEIEDNLLLEIQALLPTIGEVEEKILAPDADLAALKEEYEEVADSIFVEYDVLSGSYVSNELLGEWLLSSDREEGDTFTATSTGYGTSTYYIVKYHGRTIADSPTSSIRHIYIGAGDSDSEEDPTEEEFEIALAQAEEMLAQWVADGSSEDNFAELATLHSVDSSSALQGGLINEISEYSGYVDTFSAWALDPERASGDTGIVQNTGSSIQGYHIMYFQEWGEPVWALYADYSILNDKIDAWYDDVVATHASSTTIGNGLSYVFPATLY